MAWRFAIALTGALSLAAYQRLEFEAASVRLDNGQFVPGVKPVQGGPGSADPGRITYRRMPLVGLINQAYDVSGDQVFGVSAALDADKFTITATFPPSTTKEQFRVMLRNHRGGRSEVQSMGSRSEITGSHSGEAFGTRSERLRLDGGAEPSHDSCDQPGADGRICGRFTGTFLYGAKCSWRRGWRSSGLGDASICR